MRKLFILPGLFILFLAGCKKSDTVAIADSQQAVVAISLVIPADSVKLNPYGYAPLSALVSFSSSVAGKTVIIVKGKHSTEADDIVHVFNDAGLSHAVPVIGLYADYLNTVNIRLINEKGDTVAKAVVTIQTGQLPAGLPTSIVADIYPNNLSEPGVNLVSNYSAANPQIPLIVDNYGEIRWLLDYTTHPSLKMLRYDCGIRRLRNGNFYFGDIITDKIYEVDMLGQILNTWDLSTSGYTFHHDITEKPDGNLIASVTKAGSTHADGTTTIEDFIIEIDRQTTAVKTVWDLRESLDEYRDALYSNTPDWIHVNAIIYDTTDNTIIISGRHQGITKLTFDNKIKWILSPHRGWGANRRGEDLNQFLLTPLDAAGNKITDTAVLEGSANHPDFEWCWYQHSPIFMPNRNLLLFDNGGDARNFNSAGPKYSRAVEYKIDETNMTVQQKWQYGKERGLETFSSIVSKVQYLPKTNHVLFCPGYQVQNYLGVGGKVIEVDYDSKAAVSQLSFSAANLWGFHRTERINAYPE